MDDSPSLRHSKFLLVVLLTLGTARVYAQPTTHGTVASDHTAVYCGMGSKYYPVMYLNKGAGVEVRAVELEWLRIAPPPGACSYIFKRDVTVAADGKTATVIRDAGVRAASPEGPDAGASYKLQCELRKGDAVQIVAAEGNCYKIIMPVAASVYLAPDSLTTPAPTAPSTPLKSPPAPAPVPAAEPLPKAAAAPPARPAAAATPAPAPTPEPELTLPALEERTKAALALPLEDQPLDDLLAGYQALSRANPPLSRSQQRIVAYRIAQLKRNADLADAIRQLQAARTRVETPATQPAGTPAARPPLVDYDAVGRVQASPVYDGTRLPRLFRLVEPTTGHTVAYIQPGGQLNPAAYLGRFVGVKGDLAMDGQLKLPLMTIRSLDVLEPSPATAPESP
jgi:hypothetical protein